MKILFLISEDTYFCSHRIHLAKAALQAGFEVALATKITRHLEEIQAAGIRVFPLQHFRRSDLNPIRQLRFLGELYNIYKNYQPDIVHQVAIKPVILGSLVARCCKIPRIINALGGLGYLFTSSASHRNFRENFKKSFLRFLSIRLFRFVFSNPNTLLILQNPDDLKTLLHTKCVSQSQVHLIRGAGVDIQAFMVAPFPPEPPVIISCVSRMLWDKGIGELVEAAKILQAENINAKVLLYGKPDPENPASISVAQLQAWDTAGIITWKGHSDTIAEVTAACHISVLPSYREGLPKSLLEAASMGRPIVTTDVPGCREVVIQGENGLLVPAKDSAALAAALKTLIQNPALRAQMGQAGRARIENYFADAIIQKQSLALYFN